MKQIPITDIEGFRIGNSENTEAATGCTVIICEKGATAGVDVRGGSPASRETELLKPVNTLEKIHAVMLSGGSAFGLEAGDGAMKFLSEKEIGFDTGYGLVPIVCGASLFDFELVTNKVFPDKEMGYKACENAFNEKELKEGNVGAGTGATVGKLDYCENMMKSGLGIYASEVGDVKVGAIVAVNALGDVIDYDTKEILAGLLKPDKSGFADTVKTMYERIDNNHPIWGGNTSIGCIITNAKLDKSQCNKLASIAHNGYAQTIRPVHTTADGDTIFVMSTCEVEAGIDAVGALFTECMARAVNRAITEAKPAYGLKAYENLVPEGRVF